MINQCHYIVIDLETTGLDTSIAEPVEIAGKVYDARTLEPYPAEKGGEFSSLMCPPNPAILDTQEAKNAAEKHRISKEDILAAPSQKAVWLQFCKWVAQFGRKRTIFDSPILCGKNILEFDLKFFDRLNAAYCKKSDALVANRIKLDLDHILFVWFEAESEPSKLGMDMLRTYFGMSTDDAHRALQDVRQEGALLMRFLKLHRRLQNKTRADGSRMITFKNCFAGA